MIRQDHLVGSPRDAKSISICSIGTIRGGIPSDTPYLETYRYTYNWFYRPIK